MKKVASVVFFIAFVFYVGNMINLGHIAYADSPAPQTYYEIELEGGSKVFIMNTNDQPNSEYEYQSGLYYNTEPLVNIYFLDVIERRGEQYSSYFYKSNLVFTDDGMFFANLPWAVSRIFGSGAGTAIEFYASGSLVKQYHVKDVTINRAKLEYSVSHVSWENTSLRSFDSETNILSVTSKDKVVSKYDLTTGKRISKSVPIMLFLLFGAILALLIVLIVLKNRAKKRRK